jgi:hypothetical protein
LSTTELRCSIAVESGEWLPPGCCSPRRLFHADPDDGGFLFASSSLLTLLTVFVSAARGDFS